jgi:hypothetical protein
VYLVRWVSQLKISLSCTTFLFLLSLWRWRQHCPPKRCYPTTTLNGITTQKSRLESSPLWKPQISKRKIRGCIQKFPDWLDNEIKKTIIINTRWEATQRVMAAKLTRLTHKIAIQLHLMAESCTICSFRSRRPVRKLLHTPSYRRKAPKPHLQGFESP